MALLNRLLLPVLLVLVVAGPLSMADPATAYIYFGNTSDDAVGRANNDGSGLDGDWLTGIEDPVGVGVDSSQVYWASDEGDVNDTTTVGAAALDGSDFQASIFGFDQEPASFTVGGGSLYLGATADFVCDGSNAPPNGATLVNADTPSGLNELQLVTEPCIAWGGIAATGAGAYWIDQGVSSWPSQPTINFSSADGSPTSTVVSSGQLTQPFGAATDGTYLYWSDATLNTIARAPIDAGGALGTPVEPEFMSGLNQPGNLAVDDEFIYWMQSETDFDGGAVRLYRASKADGSGAELLFEVPGAVLNTQAGGLAVTEPSPVVGLSPEALTFPARTLGAGASSPQMLVLDNTGDAALSPPSIDVTGQAPGDFQVSAGSCAFPVPPQGACAMSVTFTPTAPGARSATVELSDNAGDSPRQFAVSGTGLGSVLEMSPGSEDFGEREIAFGPAPATTFTITNPAPANEPLEIASISVAGDQADFEVDQQDSESCIANPIAPGGSCSFEVSFDPASLGAKAATLEVDSASPSNPSTVTAALAGTGTAPELEIVPTLVGFPDTAVGAVSVVQPVTISNPGTAPLEIVSVATQGKYASSYEPDSGCAGETLAPGGDSCQVGITFSPNSVGLKPAFLAVTTDYFGTDANTILNGTGVSADASLTPASAGFGSLNVGAGPTAPQTFTYTSSGTEAVEIEGVELGGEDADQFEIAEDGDGCTGETLEQDDSCTVAVAFDPTRSGAQSALLEIDDDAFTDPHTAALAGTGTKPLIAVTPGTLSFGQRIAGSGGVTTQNFDVGNPGTGPLSIDDIELEADPAYSVDGSQCAGATIPAGTAAGCTVTVSFAPGAPGAPTGVVEVVSDAAAGPDEVQLEALACPSLQVSTAASPAPRRSVAAAIAATAPADVTLEAQLRFRAKRKTRTVQLGQQTLASGGAMVFRVPKAVRKAKAAKGVLLLSGSATALTPSGCASQPVSAQSVRVKLGR